MTRTEQIVNAENLAHALQMNGHEVSTMDVLDCLLYTRLALMDDMDAIVGRAYLELLRESTGTR